ncbi:hypothetical protein CR513_17343, partial [Mucuna pruriens]
MLVWEETRLKNQGNYSIHYVSQRNQEVGKKFVKKHNKGKRPLKINEAFVQIQNKSIKEYFQKDCPRREAWFEKKKFSIIHGIPYNSKSPNDKFVFMRNKVKALVEAIRTYHLMLNTGHYLDLLETLYVPSLYRNLVSLSKLNVTGYSFNFGNGCFSLFEHNHLIVNEHFSFLWHKSLSHISRERMKRLVKNEIILNLDFTDQNICVGCTKGKQTKHKNKGATRSTRLLEIVHTNICRPFDVNSFGNERYFITFIYDYSCYGYVYLLHEKSQAMNAFEIYWNEVERQLDKKVKVVMANRGGECCKRYYETGQHLGPFGKSFKNMILYAIHNVQYTTTK